MSTRGSVSWIEEDGSWKGIYNHYDSYPTGLGVEVFEAAKKIGIGELINRLKMVGDWREFMSGGVCEYCGKVAGQPNSIEGTILGYSWCTREEFIDLRKRQAGTEKQFKEMYEDEIKSLDEVEKNKRAIGYPDPETKHHRHGNGDKDQFDPRYDALFMEWVYVLLPNENLIQIWKSVDDKLRVKNLKCTGIKDQSGHTHILIGEFSPTDELDFQIIEKKGYRDV